MDKKSFQGLSLTEQIFLNMTIRQERDRLIERIVDCCDLSIVGIPEDSFLARDIPQLEKDVELVEKGDKIARIRILLLLKERTMAATISAKGDCFMSDAFKQELIESGEEVIEPEPDQEAVENFMTSYFEILDKLNQLEVELSTSVTELDYLVGLSQGNSPLRVIQVARESARRRLAEENEKIEKAKVENDKKNEKK